MELMLLMQGIMVVPLGVQFGHVTQEVLQEVYVKYFLMDLFMEQQLIILDTIPLMIKLNQSMDNTQEEI